ncbi:MAG: DUF1700 domain-containing protein [Syntrophomonadaceae bacterium]|nr:DUF1700 domain-containing protein [Syntrophomonadaceae bacterium]
MDNFLAELEQFLKELPERNRRLLIAKYREHFLLNMNSGKTEDEIIAFLGNPKTIARYLTANYLVEKAEADTTVKNIFKAVLGSMGLGVFNLAFFFGPFLGLIGALLALFIAGLGVSFIGAVVLSGVFSYPVIPVISIPPDLYADNVTRIGTLFLSIGLVSFGLLFLVGDYILARIFYLGTLKHLRFHLGSLKQEDF